MASRPLNPNTNLPVSGIYKETGPRRDARAQPMIFETQEQIDAALAYWQRILRLQDWDVKAKVKRRGDSQGHIIIVHESKKAQIILLDPVDWDPETDWDQDHEKTLVHELVHLHVTPILRGLDRPDDGSRDILEEQAVDLIAEAFVRVKREQPMLVPNPLKPLPEEYQK